MIRFALQDSECTIQLLHEKQPDHLMREGHFREGEFIVSPLVNRFFKAIGPTYNEYHMLHAANHQLIEIGGKFNRTVLLSSLIQQHHVVAGRQLLEDTRSFPCPLLIRPHMLRVLCIGNNDHAKWNIMFQPLLELVNDCSQLAIVRLAYTQQGYPHPTNLVNFDLYMQTP